MINDVTGKLVADKYRIGSLIRESGSGDLYMGHQEVLDKPVTVKILPSALAVDARWGRRFIDEARAASAVSHPNVLNITDFGTDAKRVSYVVYEPTTTKTLRDVVGSDHAFDETRALDIARQVAAAVIAAHTKKIVHGHLDPNNIFVGEGDAVKVIDFGSDPLSVPRDADPRYLSPEQCTAFPAADERSDVYSLGVILYEMLSGIVPYDGATGADILAKQNSEPPPPLSAFRRDLHPEIEPIVLSAIAADPERRYPNMSAFAEDLEILAGRLGLPITESGAAAAAGDAPKRGIWQTAVVVFAGISILAAALIYATSVRKTDPTTQLVADAGSLPVQPIGPATGAQEESLAKLPAMTDAEIMATSITATDTLPGGDGYNAWANGGIPPAGAPLGGSTLGPPLGQGIPPAGYIPPGGQVYTVQPGDSPFMGNFGGVELRCKDMQTGEEVPCPTTAAPVVKPSPTPKAPAGNTAVQPTAPVTGATPKPMATPPPKNVKPTTDQPNKDKAPAAKPGKSGTPKISELNPDEQ